MKQLKLLFLAVGLFVQGCSFETPLFKDEEAVKSDEAVVVFNMYVTDSSVTEGMFFWKELEYIYMDSAWQRENFQNVFCGSKNHLQANGVKSKYVVVKIAAGSYCLSEFSVEYSGGRYKHTLKSPQYSSKSSPLTFSVAAGDVKYLGDIYMQAVANYDAKGTYYLSYKFTPTFTIHNRFADAQKFMKQKYPSLSERLSEGLIHKSVLQIVIEKPKLAPIIKKLLEKKK